MDIYTTFDDLKQNEQEGADYRITWRIGNSGIAILPNWSGRTRSAVADASRASCTAM